ncbi:MAG: DUF2834 domain-containing protein [Candidatus Nanopelagicales bacterium]
MTGTLTDVRSAQLTRSSKVLCAAYAAIALLALLATWRNGGPYSHSPTAFLFDFWRDTKANNASRFIAADILMFGLAAAVWMVVDARRLRIRFAWAYILGSFLVAVSVCYPLFLIAREVKVGRTAPIGLHALDAVLLAGLASAMVALTVWIDR